MKEISTAIQDTLTNELDAISNRVLFVDDDQHFLDGMKRRLRKVFNIQTALGGDAALQAISDGEPFAVVVSDYNMPGINGVELLKEVQLQSPYTVTAMLTGQADLDIAIAALHEGKIFRFLNKPCPSDLLEKTIHDCLNQYRLVLIEQVLSDRLNRANEKLRVLNQDLEKRVEERTAAINDLYQFVSRLSGLANVKEVGELTVTTVAEQLKCDSVSLMLPDQQRTHLFPLASTGCSPHPAHGIPIEDTFLGAVFTNSESGFYNETNYADSFDSDISPPPQLPTVIAALETSKNTIGVLSASNPQKDVELNVESLETLKAIAKSSAVAIQNQMRLQERNETRDATILALAKLAENRDPETGAHLDRVAEFCRVLAETLSCSPKYSAIVDQEFIDAIVRSSPLHDIGKVGIPDNILRKPGKLTPEEFEIMKQHATIGGDTIRQLIDKGKSQRFLQMSMEIAYGHHEKFNGTGYPKGLAGTDIPLSARIMAVADVYDAITSKRVYKPPMSHEKAAKIIRSESGAHFDPDIVEAFERCEDRFKQLAAELVDEGSETNKRRKQPSSDKAKVADIPAMVY